MTSARSKLTDREILLTLYFAIDQGCSNNDLKVLKSLIKGRSIPEIVENDDIHEKAVFRCIKRLKDRDVLLKNGDYEFKKGS